MARLGRYFAAGQALHVIQRGNDRQRIFFADDDRVLFHAWLAEAARAQGCAVHAYVLMTNHVHLLLTPASGESLPRLMQSLGRRYVRHVNARRRRTGTLWEGRYRAAPIDTDSYLLRCCRYIELNPVRAHMVERPRDYRWSSYRFLALGAADPLLTPHALYRALGRSDAERQEAYRGLFRETLDAAFLDDLRAATNGGWAMGGERWKRGLAKALGRRVAPLSPGRPPKRPPDTRQMKLL